MNQKGEMLLGIVALILALAILVIFLVNIAQRECNNNKDCSGNAYCGSDYECHEFPDQMVVKQRSFVPAALIFGIAIILAAYIYRGGKIKWSGLKRVFDFEDDGGHEEHH